MIFTNIQALIRRGGPLHGPRLLLAILAVCILVFYFSAPSPSNNAIEQSQRPIPATNPDQGGKDIIQEATEKEQDKEKENGSLSDKWLDYFGHKAPANKPTTTSSSVAHTAVPSSGASVLNIADDPLCDKIAQAAQDVLVVVNAAAPDLHTQLPSRLMTHLRCAPVTIFSTVSLTLGAHTVHDAIANVDSSIRAKYHEAFQLYIKQQKAQQVFQDLAALTSGTKELEKWTIISSLIQSYKMHPEKKFFALITPTTYLSIPNLVAWLPYLDHEKPLYAGAQHTLDNIESAASSTGILLSRAALAALASLYGERKMLWEDRAAHHSSGDSLLAEALKEARVPLTKAFPNFQGDSLLNVEWSKSVWCHAPVAWSGMTPALMDLVWSFDRNWTAQHLTDLFPPEPTSTTSTKARFWARATATPAAGHPTEDVASSTPSFEPHLPPYHYSTLLTTLLLPLLSASSNRSSWDNGANTFIYTDTTRTSSYAHTNVDTCRAACDIRSKCVQYVWEPNKCSLGTSVRLGGPSDDGKMSGWESKRIRAAIAALTCGVDAKPFVESTGWLDVPTPSAPQQQQKEEPVKMPDEEPAALKPDLPQDGDMRQLMRPTGVAEKATENTPQTNEDEKTPDASAEEKDPNTEILKDTSVEEDSEAETPPTEEKPETTEG
jgi:hypothetical protein